MYWQNKYVVINSIQMIRRAYLHLSFSHYSTTRCHSKYLWSVGCSSWKNNPLAVADDTTIISFKSLIPMRLLQIGMSEYRRDLNSAINKACWWPAIDLGMRCKRHASASQLIIVEHILTGATTLRKLTMSQWYSRVSPFIVTITYAVNNECIRKR